jgi:hypothetical protein
LATSVLMGAVLSAGPATNASVRASTDAAKVLADMRSALGGADKVAAVRTVAGVGVQRRLAAKGKIKINTKIDSKRFAVAR